MIQRIFHPVGQGAFYSERHPGFNIVYDCGNWRNNEIANNVVRQAFDKNDTVDILFISHFDYDHISMIGTLKDSVRNIRCVVLPLLHDEHKIVIKAFNHLFDKTQSLDKLVDDPKEFFDGNTRIVFVKPNENPESPNNRNDSEKKRNDDEKGKYKKREEVVLETSEGTKEIEIESGVSICIRENHPWCFIPFNYKSESRSRQLLNILKDSNINKDKLNRISYVNRKQKELKECYKKVDGTANENSMLVYSGPTFNINYKYWINDSFFLYHPFSNHYHPHHISKYCSEQPACIYSGDADFNKVNVKDVFHDLWEWVGTVQVPHHGAKSSFDKDFYEKEDDNSLICPISFGTDNTYGHPSPIVLGELIENGHFPVFITEKLGVTYVQKIDLLK